MFEVHIKGVGDDNFELMQTFDTQADAENYVVQWKALDVEETWISEAIEYKIVQL